MSCPCCLFPQLPDQLTFSANLFFSQSPGKWRRVAKRNSILLVTYCRVQYAPIYAVIQTQRKDCSQAHNIQHFFLHLAANDKNSVFWLVYLLCTVTLVR